MRLILPLFLVVAVSGCQLLGKQPKSVWLALEEAEDLDCSPWPQRIRDLRINSIELVEHSFFLADVTSRKGIPLYFYAPFRRVSDVDPDELRQLKLGSGAVVLGGGKVRGGLDFVVFVRNFESKSQLEIRRLKDNVVIYKGDLVSDQVADGKLFSLSGFHWARFGKNSQDTYHVVRIASRSGKLAAELLDASFPEPPQLMATNEAGGVLAIWEDDPQSGEFKIRSMDKGKMGPTAMLKLPVSSQVESWSVTSHGGHYYLAYVDGDSLIGQADLKLTRFVWDGGRVREEWTKKVPVKDVHITEPEFWDNDGRLHILLMNWVDEESTIAQYMVSGETIRPVRFAGVFPKGARIVDVSNANGRDGDFVLVRYRDGNLWNFDICEL